MNIPQLSTSYEQRARDAIAVVLNKAQDKIGIRQTLGKIAGTYVDLSPPVKISLDSIVQPIAITSRKFIELAINRHWKLTELFAYSIKYQGTSEDETSKYYYYEVIFSQPTIKYPIPQATVSVFFRVQDSQLEHPRATERPRPLVIINLLHIISFVEEKPLTSSGMYVTFRIEGHHQDHDARYVSLTSDWLLAVLKMKVTLFKRIEELNIF